jgi:hypothetical protein
LFLAIFFISLQPSLAKNGRLASTLAIVSGFSLLLSKFIKINVPTPWESNPQNRKA